MARKQSFLRGLVTIDWRNKVFALALSLVIWFMAYNAQKTESSLTFDVFITPTDQAVIETTVEVGKAPGTDFNGMVTVRLEGQRGDLDRFLASGAQVIGRYSADWIEPDPTGAKGVGLLRLDRLDAFPQLPEGFSIVQCEPEVIRCRLEPFVDVDVPVMARIGIPADPRLVATATSVQPSAVKVRIPQGGADSVVVSTVPIDIGDRVEDFADNYALVYDVDTTYQSFVEFLGVETVRVQVTISEAVSKIPLELPVKYGVVPGFGVQTGSSDARTFIFRGSEAAIAELERRKDAGEVEVFALFDEFFGKPEESFLSQDPSQEFVFSNLPPGVQCVEVPGGLEFTILNLDFEDKSSSEENNK